MHIPSALSHSMKSKIIHTILFSFIIFNTQITKAQVLPDPRDEWGGLKTLEKILETFPKDVRLQVVDLFSDKEKFYTPFAPSNMLIDLRFIKKIPTNTILNTKILNLENTIIQKYVRQANIDKSSLNSPYSYFIQTHFRFNGKESLILKPTQEVPLIGRPSLAYIWVHSDNNPHILVFHFKNARGKDVTAKTQALAWQGWQRLQLRLPYKDFNLGRLHRPDKKNFFTSIELQSKHISTHQKKNNINIILYHFLILSDLREEQYPGYEIEDLWE